MQLFVHAGILPQYSMRVLIGFAEYSAKLEEPSRTVSVGTAVGRGCVKTQITRRVDSVARDSRHETRVKLGLRAQK